MLSSQTDGLTDGRTDGRTNEESDGMSKKYTPHDIFRMIGML